MVNFFLILVHIEEPAIEEVVVFHDSHENVEEVENPEDDVGGNADETVAEHDDDSFGAAGINFQSTPALGKTKNLFIFAKF